MHASEPFAHALSCEMSNRYGEPRTGSGQSINCGRCKRHFYPTWNEYDEPEEKFCADCEDEAKMLGASVQELIDFPELFLFDKFDGVPADTR